jgi:hypothetical protein
MGFFDGYYVKVVDSKSAVAAIFGRNNSKEKKSSFIQVITHDNSYKVMFDYEDYRVTAKPFSVSVGTNRADAGGMTLDIEDGELCIRANFSFGEFTPIKYDAMGFFRFFPFMECKHKVVSMGHHAVGKISIGEQEFSFENGLGYIEGDSGRSFPSKYFWTQCNSFDSINNLSVMASCAVIPYLGLKFIGKICIIHYNGREHRLATYRGARAKTFAKNKLVIKQGRKVLEIEVVDVDKNMRDLLAPDCGDMSRIITETVMTTINYKYSVSGKVIFDVASDCAAFEYSDVNL